MNRSEIKISVWGSLFFIFLCFFCLKTHLYRIPYQLKSRCIEQIESLGGTCTYISLNGRRARVAGTVTDEKIIGRLKTALPRIPGLRVISADFQLDEDTIKVSKMRWLSNQHIYFKKNSAELHPSAKGILDSLVAFLKQHSTMHLDIRGHTDSRGSQLFNKVLSEKRAYTIRDMLLHSNCDSTRLHTFGMGELLADSLSLEDSLARRVDFNLKEDSL